MMRLIAALYEGRTAVISTDPSPLRDEEGRTYIRTIARAMERHLLSFCESSVHWVSPIHDPNPFGPPQGVWEYDEYLMQVGLVQGNSEGMLIYVQAQKCRYEPAQLVPLLRIKVLCGADRVGEELVSVWKWLYSQEFRDLVGPVVPAQAAPPQSRCAAGTKEALAL